VERGKAINKKIFWLVAFLFLAAGTFAEAQQQAKVSKIGLLGTGPGSGRGLESFRRELYVEGKNKHRLLHVHRYP